MKTKKIIFSYKKNGDFLTQPKTQIHPTPRTPNIDPLFRFGTNSAASERARESETNHSRCALDARLSRMQIVYHEDHERPQCGYTFVQRK